MLEGVDVVKHANFIPELELLPVNPNVSYSFSALEELLFSSL